MIATPDRRAGGARGRVGQRNLGPFLAVVPAILVLVVEGAAWILAALTDLSDPIGTFFYGLPLGAVVGIIAPIVILLRRKGDSVTWSVVSVCATSLGLLFAFLLWLGAVDIACGGPDGCFS